MSEKPWHTACSGHDAPLGELHEADDPEAQPGADRVATAYTRGEGHRLVIGPTGSGKFWAAIAPMLLKADNASLIVFDVASGEAARETSGWRATRGKVLILDPYRLASDGSGALNPLELLGADDGGILGRARDLAAAIMMIEPTGGDSDYFNGQARDFLMALLIHIWTWPLEHEKTLRRVRAIIRRPLGTVNEAHEFVSPLLSAMRANEAADGYVRDAAENVDEDEDKTGGRNNFYVRQTLRENTSFLDEPEVQHVTASTTIDLRELRDGIATLYIVAPSRRLRDLGRWLRLVYSAIVPAMQLSIDERRHSDRNGVPLHIVMDEFAAFGRFDRVTDDMATVRKYGVSYTLAVQKLSQLKGLYPQRWETFVPKYLHILGSDELTTSEYVSKRIGNTVKEARSTGHSRQMGGGSQSETVSFYSAAYLDTNEISGMDESRCLVTIQGSKRPLELRKWWAFDDPALTARLRYKHAAG